MHSNDRSSHQSIHTNVFKGPMYAAAIQDHLARIHLQNTRQFSTLQQPSSVLPSLRPTKPKYILSLRQRQLKKWSKDTERLNKPSSVSIINKTAFEDDGYDSVLDPPRRILTLAEKLGIVVKPAERLSDHAWSTIKSKTISRGDISHPCPICQEPFTVQDQNCLDSYEKHVQLKCCPLCRDTDYQKMLTAEGRRQYRSDCAIRIQKTWRMWACRKKYLAYRHTYPPKDPILLEKYHMDKLEKYNNALVASMQSSTQKLDGFIQSLDIHVAASKRIIESTMAAMQGLQVTKKTDVDWDETYIAACERETDTCAICIMPLNPNQHTEKQRQREIGIRTTPSGKPHTKRVRLGLLSCSHIFHWICLERLERFDIGRSIHVCPICRASYEKREL
ncbi:hypothetical protein BASA50_003371 [Batrachochytrium salamandrivorans]|uniref:RING-type domain-containing protein n=1 Tax=Batrachochytrium salamandrivorans TaxID=1357716 RepID=A0ABQ8FII1_9FUNG|nr:hypothetical protein BASA60_009781 [Batrachochytrium salamandrivorans]KAH6598864.1 hypothetical protein BASA50_003371 [Batrachochytrium salamandrivorans]